MNIIGFKLIKCDALRYFLEVVVSNNGSTLRYTIFKMDFFTKMIYRWGGCIRLNCSVNKGCVIVRRLK